MHKNPKVVFFLVINLLMCFFFGHQPLSCFKPFAKIMMNHVFPTLTSYITCTSSFDLWMSHLRFDTFVMAISFID